ncbi:MAG: hypothetical protein HYZ14_02585 [Bacteroidetes bacterium]|nr:hypothetical protein [Bacteroidota bacterium]
MTDLLELLKEYKTCEASFDRVASDSGVPENHLASEAKLAMKQAYKNLKLAIIEELRTSNDFYQKIHEQNMQLMCNTSFELKVTRVKEGEGAFDKFSTRFEGGILSNGYLYFRSVATNTDFTFESYASYLKGTIDEHGAGEVEQTDTETALLLTLPAQYEAKISLDGSIHLKVTELDPTLERKLIAFELAGDPFNRSEKKRNLFLRNRSEMNRLIALRIEELQKSL